jgi:ankyrin repeat protein
VWAASENHTEIVELFLNYGVDVSAITQVNNSALHRLDVVYLDEQIQYVSTRIIKMTIFLFAPMSTSLMINSAATQL